MARLSRSSSALADVVATREQDLEPEVGSCSAGSNRERRPHLAGGS
jgi:hypothetical protein